MPGENRMQSGLAPCRIRQAPGPFYLRNQCLAVGVVLILAPLNFINIIAVGAAFFYLVDVRPAVKQYRAGGAQENMGPYGPW